MGDSFGLVAELSQDLQTFCQENQGRGHITHDSDEQGGDVDALLSFTCTQANGRWVAASYKEAWASYHTTKEEYLWSSWKYGTICAPDAQGCTRVGPPQLPSVGPVIKNLRIRLILIGSIVTD